MLKKLSVGLISTVNVASLETEAEIVMLYKNQFAQTFGQAKTEQIPSHDEDGNEIPPIGTLYGLCVEDFRVFITDIRALMTKLSDLDITVVEPNAQALWDRRDTDQGDRLLKNLEDEYYADIAEGRWTPTPKEPVNFDPLLEPHCDYLDEFRLVREGIVNKTMEFEEKTDFNRWITSMVVDCPLTMDQFTGLIDALNAEVSLTEEQRNTNLDLAFQAINSSIGGLDETSFLQTFLDQFHAAQDNGDFENTNPIPADNIPTTIPGCEDLTDPFVGQIVTLNNQVKIQKDKLDYAANFPCAFLASQLEQILIDNDLKPLNDQVDQALDNVYQVKGDQTITLQDFITTFRAEYEASDFPAVPAGINVPTEFPDLCAANDAAKADFDSIQELVTSTSNVKTYLAYIKAEMEARCFDGHLNKIDTLDKAKTVQLEIMDTVLWDTDAAFRQGFVGDWLEFNKELMDSASVLPVDSPLMNQKPENHQACDGTDFDFYNSIIDEIAADLKHCIDFNAFVPWYWCTNLDNFVTSTINNNQHILAEAEAEISVLLDQLREVLQTPEQTIHEFNESIREQFLAQTDEFLPAGFDTNNFAAYPDVCNSATEQGDNFTLLSNLVTNTADKLTYEKWLVDYLGNSCEAAGAVLTKKTEYLEHQIAGFQEEKVFLLRGFFLLDPANNPEDLGEYVEDIQNAYIRCRDDPGTGKYSCINTYVQPNPFKVILPETPSSCSFVTDPILDVIDALVSEYIDEQNCIAFATSLLCSNIGDQAEECDALYGPITSPIQAGWDAPLATLRDLYKAEILGYEEFDALLGEGWNECQERGECVVTDYPNLCPDIPYHLPSVCESPSQASETLELLNITREGPGAAQSFLDYITNLANEAIAQIGKEFEEILSNVDSAIATCTAEKDAHIAELFTAFNIDDLDLDDFAIELHTEFEIARDSEPTLLPLPVFVTENDFPAIIQIADFQFEAQYIRDQEDVLDDCLNFNSFAFGHTESRAIGEIQDAIVEAEAELEHCLDEKKSMTTNLCFIDYPDLSYEDCCDALMTEFDNSQAPTTAMAQIKEAAAYVLTTQVPLDVCPTGSSSACTDALEELYDILASIEYTHSLLSWLADQIAAADTTVVDCENWKTEIQALINDNFPMWTEGIRAKMVILTSLHQDPLLALPNETLNMFLERYRAKYDMLKDNDDILPDYPGFDLPQISANCPADIQNVYAIGQSFRDLLTDCKSYLKWLEAQQSGACDIEQFTGPTGFVATTTPKYNSAVERRDDLIFDLFQLKAEKNSIRDNLDAELDHYTQQINNDYSIATGVDALTCPDCMLPSTSDYCSSAVLRAHLESVALLNQVNEQLTMNGWLSMHLQQCCDDLEVSYMGLIMMQQYRLDELNVINNMILDSLWIFKADQTTTQFGLWSNDFVANNYFAPTDFAVTSIVNWIDVPANCDSPTVQEKWDQLYTMVTSILLKQDLNGWLSTQLAECDDAVENTIEQRIALNNPKLEQIMGPGMEIDTCLADLLVLQDIDQTLEDYKATLKSMFDQLYDNDLIDKAETGIVIPDIPDNADEDTKEARDMLIALNEKLRYYLTFKTFLQGLVEPACAAISTDINNMINQQRPYDAGTDNQIAVSTLWTLKESMNVNPVDIDIFRSNQAVAFALDQNKPVVSTGIVIPTPPLVCSVATAEALSDLNNYNNNLYGLLQYKQWLQIKIDECCFMLSPSLTEQYNMKELMLQGSDSKNVQKIATISVISSMTAMSLEAEFTLVGVATADQMWNVMDVPMGCSAAVVQLHANVVAICEQLNTSLDFGLFLNAQTTIACDNLQQRYISLVSDITPRLTAGDAEKDNLFMTWWSLEKSNPTQTFEEFKLEKEGYFQIRYMSDPTQFTTVETGIVIEDVPTGEFGCSTHVGQQRADLVDLEGRIKQYETYCKWVEENAIRVCDEQKDQILALYSNRQSDLTDSEQRVIRLLIDLDTLKGQQPLMLGMNFFQLIEFQWMQVRDNIQPENPGFAVPTVPANAKQEVHDAVALLQELYNAISDSLSYEKWLDEMLQMYCNDITIDITTVTGLLSDCNVDNSNLIIETYNLVDFMMDQQMTSIEYKDAVCDEYDLIFSQTAMVLVATNVDIPLVPAGCNSVVQGQVAALKAEDKSYGECLTKQEWINAQQQEECNNSVSFFEDLKIKHSFRLETDQISFTNNLNDLFVCSDPGTTFMQFMTQFINDNASITPLPSNVFIPPLPAACKVGTLAGLESDLVQLQMDIGLYKALVAAVRMGLDTCLVELDNTFSQLRTDNAQRFTDAAAEVELHLNNLFPIAKNEGELNDQSFRDRMFMKFEARPNPEADVVTLSPDIDIPDLPMQATPANQFHRDRLVEERNQLVSDLTYANWLSSKITEYCQDRLEQINDVASMLMRTEEVNQNIEFRLSSDLQMFKDPTGLSSVMMFQAMVEADSAGHPLVVSGLTVPEAPSTCPNVLDLQKAQITWNTKNNELEARLTVEAYFNDQLEQCCTTQLGEINSAIVSAALELQTAQMNNLETFLMLVPSETEQGCRDIFATAQSQLTPMTQTAITVPVVPGSCPMANQLALTQLQNDVNEIDEEYLFGEFIEIKLNHVFNGLATAQMNFVAQNTNVVDHTSSEYGLLGMFTALCNLQCTPGQTVQDFIDLVLNDFQQDSNAPMNLPLTGIPTCPLPNNCAGAPQNVLDAQTALQNFLASYQNYIDFGTFVKSRLASANDMAEDACEDLTTQFLNAQTANANRIAEEMARQDFLIGELFTKEVDPTLLSMPAFVSNTRARFEVAGSPSTTLDIVNPVVPASCDTFSSDTTDAANALSLLRNNIQPHWDYSQWLEGELQACCEMDYNDYIDRTDQASLDSCTNTVEWQLIDMYQFEGADYATQEEFNAFFLDCFEMAREDMFFSINSMSCMQKEYEMMVTEAADDVGNVQPYLDSCETLATTTDIYMKRLELLTYKVRIQDCRTMRDWIQRELNKKCEPLALEINHFLQSQIHIINGALAVQQGLVTDLYVFKDMLVLDNMPLEPETIAEFFARIKETFRMDFTQRLDPGYTIDQYSDVPHMCTEAVSAFSGLTALYDRTRFELTFNQFLTISIEECCEATYLETRDELIPYADQTISMLTDTRQCLYDDLHQCKAISDYIEQLDLEYVSGKLDLTIVVYPRSDIFVQPSEDGCSTRAGYIYDQQDILRAKIATIDDLIAQNEWLQEKLDVCCVQHQSLWQTIIDDNMPNLDACESNSAAITSLDLHYMEGVTDAANNLVAPSTTRIEYNPDFLTFLFNTYEPPATVSERIKILPTPIQDKCPAGPQQTWLDVNTFAAKYDACDDRENWLEARRVTICMRQYNELQSTMAAATAEYYIGDPLTGTTSIAADLAEHMGYGIQISGLMGESLADFETRMRQDRSEDDSAMDQFISAMNDLPAFSTECETYLANTIPINVVTRIGETESQVNLNIEDKAFVEWAIDQFTQDCEAFGMTKFVDVEALQVSTKNDAEALKADLTRKWEQVDDMNSWNGMAPASYSLYKQAQFDATSPTLQTAVPDAVDYPAPCDIYTADSMPTIMWEQASLQTQVNKINYCESFNDWALTEMHADRKSFCDSLVSTLDTYRSGTLTTQFTDLVADIEGRIANFLFILDPAVYHKGFPKYSDATEYRNQLLNIEYNEDPGDVVDPMEYTSVVTFPNDYNGVDFCVTDTAENPDFDGQTRAQAILAFNSVAQQVADQQRYLNWINARIDEVCDHHLGLLLTQHTELTNETPIADNMHAALITLNYNLLIQNEPSQVNIYPNKDDWWTNKGEADWTTENPTFSYTYVDKEVISIPENYCEQIVAAANVDALQRNVYGVIDDNTALINHLNPVNRQIEWMMNLYSGQCQSFEDINYTQVLNDNAVAQAQANTDVDNRLADWYDISRKIWEFDNSNNKNMAGNGQVAFRALVEQAFNTCVDFNGENDDTCHYANSPKQIPISDAAEVWTQCNSAEYDDGFDNPVDDIDVRKTALDIFIAEWKRDCAFMNWSRLKVFADENEYCIDQANALILQTQELASRTGAAQQLLTSSGQLEFLYGTDGTDGALNGAYNGNVIPNIAPTLAEFRTVLLAGAMPPVEYTMDFTKVTIDTICDTDDGFHADAITSTTNAEMNFSAQEIALDAELTLNGYVQGLVDGLCQTRQQTREGQQAELTAFEDDGLFTTELALYHGFQTALGRAQTPVADLKAVFKTDSSFTASVTKLTATSITPYATGFCTPAQDALEALVEAAILVETSGESDSAFGEWLTAQTITTQCDDYAFYTSDATEAGYARPTMTIVDTVDKTVTLRKVEDGCADHECINTLDSTDSGELFLPLGFDIYWDVLENRYITAMTMNTTYPVDPAFYNLIIDDTNTPYQTTGLDFSDLGWLGWCENDGKLRHLYAWNSNAQGPELEQSRTDNAIFNTEDNLGIEDCGMLDGDLFTFRELASGEGVVGFRGMVKCSGTGCVEPTEIRNFAWQVAGYDRESDEKYYFTEQSLGFQEEKFPTYEEFITILGEETCTNDIVDIVLFGDMAGEDGATGIVFVFRDETTATIGSVNDSFEVDLVSDNFDIAQVQICNNENGYIAGLRFIDGRANEREATMPGCGAMSGTYRWRDPIEWPTDRSYLLKGYAVDADGPEIRDLSFILI